MSIKVIYKLVLRFAVCLLCLYVEPVVQAQPVSFLPHRDLPIGTGCCQIVSGDFNGDGKTDLVVSYGTGTLGLLLGKGTGGFQPTTNLTSFSAGVSHMSAADVNRDGKLDLLVQSGFQAYVLLGKGDGTFQPANTALSDSLLWLVADFNGDGIPDLLSTPNSPSVFCLFTVELGNGDGTFQSPVGCGNANQGDFGSNIAVGDFNGDGKLDLVWASVRGANAILLWLGNGDGTFQPYSVIDDGTGHGPKPIVVADLNHDGKLDIVIGGEDSVHVLVGKGNGTFQPLLVIPVYEGFLHSQRSVYGNDIFVGDFNGDGKPDIALDNIVIPGNGDGTFQPPQYFAAGSPQANSVLSADLNGDGKPDLVYLELDSTHFVATALSILLNNSPGIPNAVLGYSAASGAPLLSPASIGSIYGKNLARTAAQPSDATLPTQLGGISLRVRDVNDTVRFAPLYYVSPTQINFEVPAATSIGPATLTVDDGSVPLAEAANATIVNDIAPSFFTANSQGTGVAAATALRILADGSQQPVTVFNCTAPGQYTTVTIDLTSGQPVYLSLYGTGFRNTQTGIGGLPIVKCQVAAISAVVQYSGPQPTLPGLDQLNLLLPQSLPSGQAAVQCQFSGTVLSFASNTVQIAVK